MLEASGFARFGRIAAPLGPRGPEMRVLPPPRGENGAGDGTRTRDIQLGRLELYQLSYSRSPDGGGGGRIRTSEGFADRFTVCSLWPLGNPSTINDLPRRRRPGPSPGFRLP